MAPYIQRCVLCGSNGETVKECKWCVGQGIKGNGAARTADGQLRPYRDPFVHALNRATVAD